ncbi:DNA helicase [Venturia nashicola]|nr:DNA helicase [Venturia nashicola]
MALELGERGVRVNVVAPGYIDTPTNASVVAGKEAVGRTEREIAMGRMGTPGEIAEVVGFLMGEGARYVNGAVVEVNGGTGQSHSAQRLLAFILVQSMKFFLAKFPCITWSCAVSDRFSLSTTNPNLNPPTPEAKPPTQPIPHARRGEASHSHLHPAESLNAPKSQNSGPPKKKGAGQASTVIRDAPARP